MSIYEVIFVQTLRLISILSIDYHVNTSVVILTYVCG